MIAIIEKVYQFLWGDWIVLPLPGGSSFRFSLLVLILIPAGIWFTIRTRFLPIRLFPDMLHTLFEKKGKAEGESHNSTLSALQTLIVSTATRVGMGNLVGVVAAISAGGAGAVFWMWVTALIGSSTAFVEATLAQIYKEKRPGIWWLPWWTGLLYAQIHTGKAGRKKETLCGNIRSLCNVRTDLLVWNQSGYQQFRNFCIP